MKICLLTIFLLTTILSSASTIVVSNTNDSGAGSLRDAVATANMGDIIRFNQSLISGGSDSIVLTSPILIDKGLFIKGLINGSDTLFLSGGNNSAIFHIIIPNGITYPHLDLDSLAFINGNGVTGTYGGAIQLANQLFYTQSFNFYIRNCVFRNNTAPYGGALGSFRDEASTIYLQKVNLEIYSSTFKNNKATGVGSDGGAIYIYRKRTGSTNDEPRLDILIERSNFLFNQSQDQGGAIFLYAENYQGDTQGKIFLTIKESSFNSNQTTNAGGAIYMNTTDSYAGTVSISDLDVYSSTFTNNSVVTNGGAIYVQSINEIYVRLRGCTLYGNSALNDGSAVYMKSTGTIDQANEIFLNSSILMSNSGNINYNNTIYQSGGASPYFWTDEANICDCVESDWEHYNALFNEDFFGSTLAQVNLQALELNSRNTYTMVPNEGSIAINAGNSFLTFDAQNAPILGVRDIGAAESGFCDAIPIAQNASICPSSSYDFYGQNLTSAGTYTHTIVTPGACDTIVTLTLTMQTAVTPSVTILASPGNTIMTGTMVTFTATPINGGSSPSYQWFVNGSPIGPDAPSVQTSGLSNDDIVTCTLTSNHSCVTTQTDQSNQIQFTVHTNNDEPCDAIALDVYTTCMTEYFANHIATNTSNVGVHTCATTTSKDIWFQFVAPASGNVEIYTFAGTLLDAVMSVYQGDNCSSLFEVGCVDDDGTNQMPQGMVTGATPGAIIYIRVSSFGTINSGNFGICVVDPGVNGIEEVQLKTKVYPNPTQNMLKIESESNLVSYKILSLDGKTLTENTNFDLIDVSSLSSGIYLIEVQTVDGKSSVIQFVKE